MANDINWDEIRPEELHPSVVFDLGRKDDYKSKPSGDGITAPLLQEQYTDVSRTADGAVAGSQGGVSGEHRLHCHWSPRVPQTNALPHLIAALVMCAVFMFVELIGGYLAGSLAIMCDAAHLLSDCAGFGLALSALWLAGRPPHSKMSYGYKRAEVLGALLSIILIWLLTGIFIYLATLRLFEESYEIEADTMMIVSGLGVIINVLMALVLHGTCYKGAHLHAHSHGGISKRAAPADSSKETPTKNGYRNLAMDPLLEEANIAENGMSKSLNENGGHYGLPKLKLFSNGRINHQNNGEYSLKEFSPPAPDPHPKSSPVLVLPEPQASINVRAAVIHILGDLIQSAGVFIASLVIKLFPEAKIVDPICTFIFSIIVMATTIRILREATEVLMEAVPKHVRYESLLAALRNISGVRAVHSLHIWSLTNNYNIMTAHLAIDQFTDSEATLRQALHIVRGKFLIDAATIQVERYEEASSACPQCNSGADT